MHRDWNDSWSAGWWWMSIMMIAFWGGIIWIAVTLIRHSNRPLSHTHPNRQRPCRPARLPRRSSPSASPAARSSPTITAADLTSSANDHAPPDRQVLSLQHDAPDAHDAPVQIMVVYEQDRRRHHTRGAIVLTTDTRIRVR